MPCAGKPIKKLPESTTISLGANTAELYDSLSKTTGYSVHQLRITKSDDGSVVPNSQEVSVESTGLGEQSTILVKDLGTSKGLNGAGRATTDCVNRCATRLADSIRD
jgi:hypothetical protein